MPTAPMDDTSRGAYPDRRGMNFFACEIDGAWRGGWFRIDGRMLQVSSETRCRTVTIVDPDLLTELLRKVLTEIVHESPFPDRLAERREGQEIVSASLHRSGSALGFPTDSDSAEKRGQ